MLMVAFIHSHYKTKINKANIINGKDRKNVNLYREKKKY